MSITEDMKKRYVDDVYAELIRRGFRPEEVPLVIAKTGFVAALEAYPEEQLSIDPYNAVNELLVIAVRAGLGTPTASV